MIKMKIVILIPCKRLNSSILPIDGTLTGSNPTGWCGTEINANETVFNIPKLQAYYSM